MEDIYKINNIEDLLSNNTYPGRGLIVGKTPDGTKSVAAYFIMGRSENSRNRIFVDKDETIFTEPFDPSKVEDPSLIIYAAVRHFEKNLIVTNGDQTDTIYDGLQAGKTFAESLESRDFEPDGPNWTPRISALLTYTNENFDYQMNILKSIDAEGSATARHTYHFPSVAGLGHFLHTYVCDGNPIPTFQGEPERIAIDDDIETFTDKVWNSLNADNKISLWVMFADLKTGETQKKIINKYM